MILGILFAVLLLPQNILAQTDEQITLTIENNSSEEICAVGLVPAGTTEKDITEDMLRQRSILPGQSEDFSVEEGVYLLGLFDCTFGVMQQWDDVALTQDMTLTYEQIILTIENNSDEEICGIGIIPAGTAEENLTEDMLRQRSILPGQSEDFSVGEGTYLIGLLDCDFEVMQRWEMNLTQNTTLTYGQITLTIENNSDEEICAAGIVPTGTAEEDLTDDMLQPGSILPEQSEDFSVERGTYQIGLFSCTFEMIQRWDAMEITQDMTLTYTPTDHRTKTVEINDLGLQAYHQGQYTEALGYYEQALAMAQELGEQQNEGTILSNIGAVYKEQGQYNKALMYFQQALDIHHETGNRLMEGTTLNNIGTVYGAREEYDEALTYFQQALDIHREMGNRAEEGTTLNNIGTVYATRDEHDEALAYFQQALDIYHEIGDRIGEVGTFNNIGAVYRDQEQYDEALAVYERALDIARDVGSRNGEGTILNNIGELYARQEEYDEALAVYERALDIHHETGNRPMESIVLSNIGGVYNNQGQYDEALAVYEQALDIQRNVGDRTGESGTLNGIGIVYLARGQYGVALTYFHQALDITRETGNRVGEGAALNGIGSVYESQGQYSEALIYVQQALDITREVGNRAEEGTTLNNIGELYVSQEQYSEALSYFQQALDISRETGNHAGEGITLNNIGALYETQGQYGEALIFMQQALDIVREVGNHAEEGSILNNIGFIYASQGQYDQALSYFQQALDIHRETGNPAGESVSLINMAAMYYDRGQYDSAISYYVQVADIYESIHTDIGLESGQAAFFSRRTFVYDNLVKLLASSDPIEAFYYTERGRSRTFLFQLGNERLPFGTGADAALLDEWQAKRNELITLQQHRIELASQLIPPMDSIAEIDVLITDTEQELRLLEDRIAIQNPALTQFTSVNIPDLATMQAAIPDNTTLLSYYLTEETVFAFILTPSTFDLVLLEIEAEQIRENVTLFRNDETQIEALSRLYELLIAPIKDHLSTSSLVIAPHDVLNYVPFGALRDEQRFFLVDKFIISYTPSITVYTLLKANYPETSSEGTPLILGNPETSLSDLPGAEAEALNVADVLGAEVILGTEATETLFYQRVSQSSIIHVAAHGSFNSHNTLSSFLALSEDSDNDGHLEVREVYSLSMQEKAPLVVLSACQTAVGKLTAGDDFQGLTRAFLLSGARTVIASLWSVNDEATSVLMVEFYRNRNSGMSDAEALTAAQQAVRDDPDHPEWANPYYWSAFVLVGLEG